MTMKYFNLGGSDDEPLYSSCEKDILRSRISSLQYNILEELENINIDINYINECQEEINNTISEILEL